MSDATSPSRWIRLVYAPADDGVGVFCVRDANSTVYYTFREIACAIGGRGFVVHRLGLGTLYHVRVGAAADCECECLGFLRHGYCRHIQGLLALTHHGKLCGFTGRG